MKRATILLTSGAISWFVIATYRLVCSEKYYMYLRIWKALLTKSLLFQPLLTYVKLPPRVNTVVNANLMAATTLVYALVAGKEQTAQKVCCICNVICTTVYVVTGCTYM